MKSMLHKVVEAILLLTIPLWSVSALPQDAESYYVENVETIIQSKCIGCHRSGGQAGGTSLRFTSSASSNHDVFDSYVNTPTPGSRANTVLTKIRGGAGHGGGVQVTEGSSEYQRFTQYMDLLSEVPEPTPSLPSAPLNVSAAAGNASATVSFSVPSDDGGATIISYAATSSPGSLSGSCTASPCLVEGLSNGTAYTFTVSATNEAGEGPDSDSSNAVTPSAPEVFRMTLEEPIDGKIHTGVGNLRGWAVASSGITKVEILIDGAYAYDAPYGGSRPDLGAVFPDVEGSLSSGYSLAYNYSELPVGEHTI
ncbi:MAG: fibronectin type III domain-containing protein, partial [Luminiphilus sp.]|nr:fibronectin type III domain-containing protein [Luminiphilus sp.]